MRSQEVVAAAGWLRTYRRAWLRPDVVGGVTAGPVVVPQAMAYATIADLPVHVGLSPKPAGSPSAGADRR